MVEKTVFENDEEIKEYVKNAYDIDIYKVEKIDRGSANIYFLNNNKYVLKEFQEKYKKSEVDKEIAIINHLKENDIKVPIYVKTKMLDYSDVYKGKTIIIQEFIEGNTLDNNEGTYEQTIECATFYGKIVKALETLDFKLEDSDILEKCSKENIEKAIIKHENLLSKLDEKNEIDLKIKTDLLEKISMLKDIKDKVNFSEIDKVTIMNSHGDYNLLQFIYKDGKINAVIDFVTARKLPIIWEIIRSYSYIDKDAKDGEFNINTFCDYVEEVNKYVKLNKYDIKYIVYLYLIQILSSTYGYKNYLEGKKNVTLLNFGYFRTKICRYLYKNADEISKELKKRLD